MAFPSQVPTVTMDDLHAFQARHFLPNSNIPVGHLMETVGNELIDDDELGYYPDGVKRTLTDQQIEIFRHSEIQALQRKKRLKDVAEREQEEEESMRHQTEDSLVDVTHAEAEAQPARKVGQGHNLGNSESNGQGHGDRERPAAHETIQTSNDKPGSSVKHGEMRTSPQPKRPPHSASANPFGRRLVSYDD
ncbi:hypothetical protein FQN50_003127 [Emmonsiellopsis sp. PD_5]|nr:hypothetical protein FQN50_003127 [Emmonsiellopsis sp. PD_5]